MEETFSGRAFVFADICDSCDSVDCLDPENSAREDIRSGVSKTKGISNPLMWNDVGCCDYHISIQIECNGLERTIAAQQIRTSYL